jgi:hypothetical protein
MKKAILLSALFLALVSCSGPAVEEQTVAVDSTACVKADTTCVVKCDSLKADTTKVK